MKLPRSRFDTRNLSPRRALEAWRESIDVAFDIRLRGEADESFHARVDAFLFGNVFVGTASGAAQNFDRSRMKIGRDLSDYYMLQFYLQGSCGARDGGSDRQTRPGDLFIVDAAQPLATATSDFGNLNLIVPRRLLAPLLKAPDEQNMRVLRGGMPLVGLFRDHLGALYRRAGELTVEQAHSIIGPTLELAASALNDGVAEENGNAVDVALFAAIRRHIDANIGDPGLSPERVAAAFGISRRKLYYLFEQAGGFAACVQEERLRRCCAALLNPAGRSLSIAEIAEAHGFASPGSFSRAFRRVIGMTAREVRDLAAQGRGQRRPPDRRRADWARWIAEMR
jgi:AraC-like DNA-binding protein